MQIFLVPILIIIAIFLLLFIIVSLFMVTASLLLELPYVGANKKRIDTIIKLASIKPGQTVIDLGSGDGRLLIAAARKGARSIGYEINPLLIALTLFHSNFAGLVNQVEVKNQSLWKADLKVADVIFIYALKKSMAKFEHFIYQGAIKGTRVVVNTNPFPSKKPIKSANGIFLYLI